MRRLLVLALMLCSGCVLRAALRGGPNAQCWRTYGKGNTTLFEPTQHGCSWMHAQPRRSPTLVAATAQPVTHSRRTGRVRARTTFLGGHLELIGMPRRSTDEVILAFRPVATLANTCEPRLFRDTKPLAIGEFVRHSDHELLATLSIDELGPSDHFNGAICGQSFELDRAGRDTIADFVARFQQRVEERSSSDTRSAAVDQRN